MLEFEIAALYYFVAGILNLPAYFDEVPEDMEMCILSFSAPEKRGFLNKHILYDIYLICEGDGH